MNEKDVLFGLLQTMVRSGEYSDSSYIYDMFIPIPDEVMGKIPETIASALKENYVVTKWKDGDPEWGCHLHMLLRYIGKNRKGST